MFEMYTLIAVFTVQIVVLSVLGPLSMVDRLRAQIIAYIADHAPPIEPSAVARVDRRLRQLRMLGLGTAVIGLALLGAMIRYMLRPDWDDGPLEAVIPAFWLLQLLPQFLALVTAGRFMRKLARSLPREKRMALLQPRGLFDFVSRFAVGVAVLVYFAHLALLLYIERHPFPGFAGLPLNLLIVTLIYGLIGVVIFKILRKVGSSSSQALENQMRALRVAVSAGVYSCIVSVTGLSLNMSLVLLDQQRLEPTFLCIFLILCALLSFGSVRTQLRIPLAAAPAASALAR